MIRIDTSTGTFATEDTPDEFVKELAFPEYHSILHWVKPSKPQSSIPERKDHSYER
jgi:hypothetical protein